MPEDTFYQIRAHIDYTYCDEKHMVEEMCISLLSVTPIIVESARLSLLNIKQQGCPSILFKLDSKSFQN